MLALIQDWDDAFAYMARGAEADYLQQLGGQSPAA